MIIKTSSGRYQGQEEEEGIFKFLGIPYALPPIGNYRFKRAVPYPCFDDVLASNQFPAKAPQPNAGMLASEVNCPESEDCLYLHIWTPSVDTKKPVLVFLHGGAFVMGEASAKLYDGTAFVDNGDIVYVSIQYRLGILGFTDFRYLNDDSFQFESNCGLSDQLEALKWIHTHIEAFGGDPNQITLMGESAGGSSILALMTSPLAKGLFHQGIVQSPLIEAVLMPENAEFWAKRALNHLGLSKDDSKKLLTITSEKTIEAASKMMAEFTDLTPNIFPFGPVIDDILPESIDEAFSLKKQLPIPLLIGTNLDEIATFIRRPDPWFPKTEKQLNTLFDQHPNWNQDTILKNYPDLQNHQTLLKLGRDILFAAGGYGIAQNHSKIAPVFRYQFDFVTTVAQALQLGAFHGCELPFVFHNLNGELRKIIGPDIERAKRLADNIHFAWINFIKYGNPSENQKTMWEAFTIKNPVTLRFDIIDRMEEGLDEEAWKTWINH